ncbi:hypothetical protein JTB14_017219 [Gonioctena quinquepunctata]|nr:hypothetical protein JTB14_017219 [Gonioctena quinquepunctata]
MEPLLRARWPNKVAITAYADDIALAINALKIVSHWAESHKLDISVNKTKYIVFSKLSINRNPIVRYRDVPIDRVRHLKYLGVILDERMSFTEHIGYISNEARSIFQSLRKFALPRWGNCVDSLKKIYQVAIIPIVGYASEVWLDKVEFRQNKQKLRSMQCFCLRVILGAYKTVPNETAFVLAKQLPIDLELKGRLAFSELRKTGRTIILGHEVRAWLVGAWQALWNSTSKGRHCYELIPNLSSWTDIGHNQLSRVIISFSSSHGNCGAHLFRIGKRNSPECDICGEEDTPAHRLRNCLRYFMCRAFEIIEPCSHLWCGHQDTPLVCKTKKGPPLEGTECGFGKWCVSGYCEEFVNRRAERVPIVLNPQDGRWGDWTPLGACSRICGTGVQFRSRKCDNPPPSYGGKFCEGLPEEWRICKEADCPGPLVDMRAQQCKQLPELFDLERKRGMNFTWLPYESDENAKKCKFICVNAERKELYISDENLIDGTPCSYENQDNICVQGACQLVGCDGVLHSSLRRDRCGVCGGNNSECSEMKVSFQRKLKRGQIRVLHHRTPDSPRYSHSRIAERYRAFYCATAFRPSLQTWEFSAPAPTSQALQGLNGAAPPVLTH